MRLYELIAGRTAFGAETASDCLVKVLESEPDWALLPHARRSRFGGCSDAASKKTSRFACTISPMRGSRLSRRCRLRRPRGSSTRPRNGVPLGRGGRGSRAVGAALAGGYVAGRGTGAPGVGVVSRLTFRQGNIGKARFTPDGRGIVYSAAWDGEPYRLYSTQLGSPQSRAIDLPPADLLAVSRQSQLAISMGRPAVDGWEPVATLAVTPLAGGAPRELYTDVVGADWSPDGATMAIVRRVGNATRLEFPVGHGRTRSPDHPAAARVPRRTARVLLRRPERVWRADGRRTRRLGSPPLSARPLIAAVIAPGHLTAARSGSRAAAEKCT